MALQNCYEYTELVQPDAFRIILLQPSTLLFSPIQCTLITTTLLEYDNDIVDHYTALSYVWGDEKDKRTVIVDGKSLEITATLESALRHIRDPRRVLRVWADGICINQLDTGEKNVQVSLMGFIYELARHTIIFLGKATNESEAVMEVLCSNAKTSFDRREGSELWLNVAQRLTLDSVIDRKKSKGKLTVPFPSSVPSTEQAYVRELAKEHILQRPWFTRVWVLQELVLSADPWIQIGTRRMRWNMFCDHLLYPPASDELSGGLQLLSDMQNCRTKLAPSWLRGTNSMLEKQHDLLQTLHPRRGFGVKDPRDMLYAHLGIVDANSKRAKLSDFIQVDYTKTIREVYMDAALYLIPLRGSFDFLSHVEDVPLGNRRDDLPSWVPDWTSPHTSSEVTRHIGETSPWSDIELVHIGIRSAGVLGCIGDTVGVIEEILDGMPPCVDLGAFCWKVIAESPSLAKALSTTPPDCQQPVDQIRWLVRVGYTPKIADKVVQGLHRQLGLWIGEQHCRPIGSHYMDTKLLIQERLKTYLECQPGSMPPAERCGYNNSNYSIKLKVVPVTSYLLLGMTDPDGPGCFSSRLKVARLSNRGLAMVPGTAQIGDVICRFNFAETTYILRKISTRDTELDTTILNFFIDSKLKAKENGIPSVARTKLLDDLDASKLEHYNFISECFADLPSTWKRYEFWFQKEERGFWKADNFWDRDRVMRTPMPKSWTDFVPNIFALH